MREGENIIIPPLSNSEHQYANDWIGNFQANLPREADPDREATLVDLIHGALDDYDELNSEEIIQLDNLANSYITTGSEEDLEKLKEYLNSK